jgi:hypothetical protein
MISVIVIEGVIRRIERYTRVKVVNNKRQVVAVTRLLASDGLPEEILEEKVIGPAKPL